MSNKEEVLGLLVGGSIAHGFATEISDVDIMIVLSDEEYQKRRETGSLTYWNTQDVTYSGGAIDGKYISRDFLNQVATLGSEPARFAFDGAIVAFSKLADMPQLLRQITRYPIERKEDNIRRFCAQLVAWKWYFSESVKHQNEYLRNIAISNTILFGGRLVLAHNEMLYPYHKWFLRVLEQAPKKPDNILQMIDSILKDRDTESIDVFYRSVINLINVDVSTLDWGSQFSIDSELNWIHGNTPIPDI